MVTKMADKVGLKYRYWHFGPDLRLLETLFKKKKIVSAQLNNKQSF